MDLQCKNSTYVDYKEEQASELEALRSIYSNEEFAGINFDTFYYKEILVCVCYLEISSDPHTFEITVVVEGADEGKSGIW